MVFRVFHERIRDRSKSEPMMGECFININLRGVSIGMVTFIPRYIVDAEA
jgi:hypothetical protein